VTYFFDNNVSPRLVRILRELGVSAIHVTESFPADASDAAILTELRTKDWILVTCDLRIRTRPPEIRALRAAGVKAVFFKSFFLRLGLWDQGVWLLRNWSKIHAAAQAASPGTCCMVKQRGGVDYM
jgi:predicted nuclease of predicted toxin-antitoxin system